MGHSFNIYNKFRLLIKILFVFTFFSIFNNNGTFAVSISDIDIYIETQQYFIQSESKYALIQYVIPRSNPAANENEKGIHFARLSMYKMGLGAFEKALKYNNLDYRVLNNIGIIYLKLNQYEKAGKSFELAVEQMRNKSIVMNNQSILLALNGKLKAAVLQLRKAAILNQDPKLIENNIRLLKKQIKKNNTEISEDVKYGEESSDADQSSDSEVEIIDVPDSSSDSEVDENDVSDSSDADSEGEVSDEAEHGDDFVEIFTQAEEDVSQESDEEKPEFSHSLVTELSLLTENYNINGNEEESSQVDELKFSKDLNMNYNVNYPCGRKVESTLTTRYENYSEDGQIDITTFSTKFEKGPNVLTIWDAYPKLSDLTFV